MSEDSPLAYFWLDTMATLHHFNPETDYALASNSACYNPPVPIKAMKLSLSLLPALYASEGDAILLPQESELLINRNMPFGDLVAIKGLRIVTPANAAEYVDSHPGTRIRPWGWNPTLIRWLESLKVNPDLLPDKEEMSSLRGLSHRRLTMPFLMNMAEIRNPEIEIPHEFSDPEEALDFWKQQQTVYFKAPWSSSGRGLMFTKGMERRHIEPWLKGIIRTQGSVMGEKAYSRILDFASEWECAGGSAAFLGFSTFITSERGKYKSNAVAPQESIAAFILTNTETSNGANDLAAIIDRQKLMLESYVAPFYQGPLGIDMLVTENHNINPCVEINIRNTMGRVAVDIFSRITSEEASEEEKNILKNLTKAGIFSPMNFLSAYNEIGSN